MQQEQENLVPTQPTTSQPQPPPPNPAGGFVRLTPEQEAELWEELKEDKSRFW
jgi:hypothetical protein